MHESFSFYGVTLAPNYSTVEHPKVEVEKEISSEEAKNIAVYIIFYWYKLTCCDDVVESLPFLKK